MKSMHLKDGEIEEPLNYIHQYF